ncbi:hypothetical protein MKW92_032463 [Papaver armeniacum]|nr:hypothetical protein MKW92_032463 [Papaver armeniacum]
MKLIFLTVAALLVFVSQAQNTPQDYLDAHNTARASVYTGAALTWSIAIENYAKNVANSRKPTCSIQATIPREYGENFAINQNYITASLAVGIWVAQGSNYYSYPTCAPGHTCAQYTQVVWRNSIQLGCAQVNCTNSATKLVVCYYDPPGNVPGELPY